MKKNVVVAAVITAVLLAGTASDMEAYAGTWQLDSAGWRWQEDDGSYPVNEWKWIDGNGDGTAECYCFDSRGYLYCDTITPDGYQVNKDGAWVNGTVIQTKPVDPVQEADPEAENPQTQNQAALVPINQLANLSSLKKKCTDAEFQAAYDAAVPIVSQLAGESREEQLTGIARALRKMFDSGQVGYSMSGNHYNDPYGFFVLGLGSCAGCTRATGLCLNMLGIPYEHVNENQYVHQWCRVNIDGTYWICDAYGLYVGPEPAPYVHPNFTEGYSDSAWSGLLPFLY